MPQPMDSPTRQVLGRRAARKAVRSRQHKLRGKKEVRTIGGQWCGAVTWRPVLRAVVYALVRQKG